MKPDIRAPSSVCHLEFTSLVQTHVSLNEVFTGMSSAKKNIIILTHGWTGSSVFSALFGRAGYWLGSETVRKIDYDTFENVDLVKLNGAILDCMAPGIDHEHAFDDAHVQSIERAAASHDLTPYRQFVERCSANGLWIWKDPRLTWTIRVWANVLDLDRTAFLILTRDDLQAWISANRRRHIQSRQFTRKYNDGITNSNIRFLEERGLPWLKTSFEELLLQPEQTLVRLNDFFATQITMENLQSVCREPLYRKNRGLGDFVVASLIYAKNFHERDGRGRARARIAGSP